MPETEPEPAPAPVPDAPPAPDPAELLRTLQRVQADFQNYRARMDRDRAQWRDDLTGEAVRPLLAAFDNLARLLAAAKAGGTLESLVQGVSQVESQIEKALLSVGVARIPAEGRAFDPKLHEILAQVPAPGVPAGQVVNVVEQGYTAGGRVLRPAKVTVSGTA